MNVLSRVGLDSGTAADIEPIVSRTHVRSETAFLASAGVEQALTQGNGREEDEVVREQQEQWIRSTRNSNGGGRSRAVLAN